MMLEPSTLPFRVVRSIHLYAHVFYGALLTAIDLLGNRKVKCNTAIRAYSASIYDLVLGNKSFIKSEVRRSMFVESATPIGTKPRSPALIGFSTPVAISTIKNRHIKDYTTCLH